MGYRLQFEPQIIRGYWVQLQPQISRGGYMIKSFPLTPSLDGAIEGGPPSEKDNPKIETTE